MTSMRRHFWNTIVDNKATIITTLISGAFVGAMFLRGCGATVQVEGPRPVCGDRYCAEGESSQYERDPRTGVERKDKDGNKIANKNYCKLDCFNGDGVYDDAKDKTQ